MEWKSHFYKQENWHVRKNESLLSSAILDPPNQVIVTRNEELAQGNGTGGSCRHVPYAPRFSLTQWLSVGSRPSLCVLGQGGDLKGLRSLRLSIGQLHYRSHPGKKWGTATHFQELLWFLAIPHPLPPPASFCCGVAFPHNQLILFMADIYSQLASKALTAFSGLKLQFLFF